MGDAQLTKMRSPGRAHIRLLAVAVAASMVVSCIPEPPIRESILLRFDQAGHLQVFATTRIRGGKDESRPVQDRISAAREAALRNDDFWARALRPLSPPRERVTFGWEKGELRTVERSALLEDQDAVTRLFSEVPVSAFVAASGLERTLEIHPARTLRATARQRQIVNQALGRFAGQATNYLRATATVYHYLDDRPERARDVLAHVFADRLGGEKLDERFPVSEAEAVLAESLKDAMGALTSVFSIAEEEAFTLDELSRLVYDPFPAVLSVEVPGPAEEVAGFRHGEGNLWSAPSVGIWGAMNGLLERWVTPEPISVLVSPEGLEPTGKLDIDAFAALPRTVKGTPGADDVRAALEAGLAPARVYRLKWRLPAAEGAAAKDAGE
ncbi:MAG: hypothetical protein DIJKHBIC_00641 [Thermoanaerobaculia bacterium]|nr:hypothetical protein [Thermoanaerobaculia bacterium]